MNQIEAIEASCIVEACIDNKLSCEELVKRLCQADKR